MGVCSISTCIFIYIYFYRLLAKGKSGAAYRNGMDRFAGIGKSKRHGGRLLRLEDTLIKIDSRDDDKYSQEIE